MTSALATAALGLATTSTAAAGEHGPTTQTLPATGLLVDLPTGWVARNEVYQVPGAPTGSPGVDLITRLAPRDPHMHMTAVSFGGHTCQEWFEQQPRATWAKGPAFLPSGWFPQTERDAATTAGHQQSSVCLDTLAGVLIVSMELAGSFDDAAATAFTPILVSLAKAAGVDSAAVAPVPVVPPPATTPAPPPTPPPAETPPPPPAATPEPPPSPQEPEDDGGDDDDGDDDASLGDSDLITIEVVLGSIQPDDGRDAAFGGTLALDGSSVLGEEAIGFAYAMGLSVGINSSTNVPFDARIGLGPGLRVGVLRLVPVAGVGADTIGAGDAGSFKVPAALYYYGEGRLRLGLGSGALEGIASHARRGSIEGEAGRIPYENRITARFVFDLEGELGLATGFHYVDYVDADFFGGSIGLELQ